MGVGLERRCGWCAASVFILSVCRGCLCPMCQVDNGGGLLFYPPARCCMLSALCYFCCHGHSFLLHDHRHVPSQQHIHQHQHKHPHKHISLSLLLHISINQTIAAPSSPPSHQTHQQQRHSSVPECLECGDTASPLFQGAVRELLAVSQLLLLSRRSRVAVGVVVRNATQQQHSNQAAGAQYCLWGTVNV